MSEGIELITSPKINPPLEVPSASPNVGMNDPGFNLLTGAEKLNDSNYRKIVYKTYPNEPTCACEPMTDLARNKSSNDKSFVSQRGENLLLCRSGCKRICCSRMRKSVVGFPCQDNANKDDNKLEQFMPFGNSRETGRRKGYDEDETKKRMRKVDNGGYCCIENRLRGGGEGDENKRDETGMYLRYEDESKMAGENFYEGWNGRNDWTVERRLEAGGGGGGCGINVAYKYAERRQLNRRSGSTERCCKEENLHEGYRRADYNGGGEENLHLDGTNTRSSMSSSYPPIAAGCCCPGRENILGRSTTRQRENGRSCSNKPSQSVDCLVKAFRETQEFVDSLGKVPGLAGLGLMDPAESPYFGRVRGKDSNFDGMKSEIGSSVVTGLPNPQCTGPCNSEMLRERTFGRCIDGTPLTIGVPGRGGVVREAVPEMPEAGLTFLPGKWRLRDEKEKGKGTEPSGLADIETGPCGEPKCKAKLRKDETTEQDLPAVETGEAAVKKIVTIPGSNGTGRRSRTSHRFKASNKLRMSRGSSINGGRGKRRSSGKTGRRVIGFVYSAGDTYSGSTCGHKYCIEERHRVPGNMGWLWNIDQTIGKFKPRPGWKPGAISRRLKEILREAKANFSHQRRARTRSSRSSSTRSRTHSPPSRGKRAKPHGDRRLVKKAQARKREEEKEEIEPPPTLHIHRKDGTYYVTMYPIKQETMNVPMLEEPMKPLQFKIAKNKDDESTASSSTASDMEIEFSPPAAVNRYRKKANVVHVDTQVNQHEINNAFKTDGPSKSKNKKKGKKGKK